MPSNIMLVMNYMYAGDYEFGITLLWRVMNNLVNRMGAHWDMSILYHADDGSVWGQGGNDFYQTPMLWSVPAVINGQSLAGPCQPGGLVDRIITAASPQE